MVGNRSPYRASQSRSGRLDLTDAQRERIDSILAEAKPAEAGIRSVLTPDQGVRFDSLLADLGGIRMRVERRMVVSDSADDPR